MLHLDSGNTSSYPGSGSTWTDLTGNGYNATLSGATYNATSSGVIDFDGVSDYADIANNSGYASISGSIEVWFKAIDQRGFILYGGTSTLQNFFILHGSGTSGFTNESMMTVGRNTSDIGYTSHYRNGETFFINSGWYQFVTTLDGISNKSYLNGQPVSVTYVNPAISYNSTPSSTQTGFWLNTISTGALRIGGRYTAAALPFKGFISMLRIYKDPLSDSDVLTNYNGFKSRYGLS